MRKYFHSIFVFFLASVLSVLFYSPFLKNIQALGIQDWDMNFAWTEVIRRSILTYHQFPFWDPYRCGGIAHFASPEVGVISLQTLFALLFGTVVGIKVVIIVHGIIAYIGSYIFLRNTYKLSESGALIASLIYAFSGIVSSFLSTGMVVFINFAYIPYILFFLFHKKPTYKSQCIAALLFAVSFYYDYHIPLILSVFILINACIRSIIWRNTAPIKSTLLFFAFSTIFILPKLILAYELIQINPPTTDLTKYIYSGYSLEGILFFMFSQAQKLGENPPVVSRFSLDENSLYIGYCAGILLCIGIINAMKEWRKKQNILLFFEILLILLLMAGHVSSLSLFNILNYVPVYTFFRVAQRFRFVFILPISIFIGYGVDYILSRIEGKYKSAITLVLFLIIFIDLTWFAHTHFFGKTLIVKPYGQVVKKSTHIEYIDYSINTIKFSYYENTIPAILQNSFIYRPWTIEYAAIQNEHGTLKCVNALSNSYAVEVKNSPHYKGEWYSLYGKIKPTIQKWTPNLVHFKLTNTTNDNVNDVLILNQNYYPGWFIKNNGSIVQAENYNGLLSTPINSKTEYVTFFFNPFLSLWRYVINK